MKQIFSVVLILLSLLSCEMEDWAAPGVLVPRTVDQDASVPSVPINGTLLHVESFGQPNDPLLIVIHGGPGADYRSMLRTQEFADEGFHVVCYDQRGSGLSKRENKKQYEGAGAVQLFIDDLDALIDHFQTSPNQKVFLLGHSWGAMLATGYINQHPDRISGAILAEPGGFTWKQTNQYLSGSNKIAFFSEALNDAVFPEQIIAGRSEHEILDYKASFFSNFENAPGNTIGNAGPYPFWRNGAVAFSALIDTADKYGFDFTTNLDAYPAPVLFMYSELNRAYGLEWAQEVAAPFPNVIFTRVDDAGHELLYFGWDSFYPQALEFLTPLK